MECCEGMPVRLLAIRTLRKSRWRTLFRTRSWICCWASATTTASEETISIVIMNLRKSDFVARPIESSTTPSIMAHLFLEGNERR